MLNIAMNLIALALAIATATASAEFTNDEAADDDSVPDHRELQITTLTALPTSMPTFYPTYTDDAYSDRGTKSPRLRPTRPCTGSFTVAMYDSIEEDIATLMRSIEDVEARTHFLGGIVRLAAHDFMDYNPSTSAHMGPDGCFDPDHQTNAGLDEIWCADCELTLLHEGKYAHISRADFWVASANAVIHLTSVRNALNLKDTFRWGRRDRASCIGSGQRLPQPSGCQQIEAVFLTRMGFSWREVVALLGAHTLGRGHGNFSGHHGTWKDSNLKAQVFDKHYYRELSGNAWRMRNRGGPENGGPPQDWTTGTRGNQMMLNTDVCLIYDIDENVDSDINCCTTYDGRTPCTGGQGPLRRCPKYSQFEPRRSARQAVIEYGGGDDNSRFYSAFAQAWVKATTLGQTNLAPLELYCDSEYW